MRFQNLTKSIEDNPIKLFLIDGLGALLSGTLYIGLLANFQSFFGMPLREIYILTVLAAIYAVYSFSCYFLKVDRWPIFLKAIAIANLLHCCLTIGLIIYFKEVITIWGVLYFIGELIIVVPLALFEWRTASRG